jgi:hypothetical protein
VVTDATVVSDPDEVTDVADSDEVTDIADSDAVTETDDVTTVADGGIAFDPSALAALAGLARPACDLADPPATFLPDRFTFAIAVHRTPIRSSGERGNRDGYQR